LARTSTRGGTNPKCRPASRMSDDRGKADLMQAH
jgi:hypothetical protein